MKMIFMLECSIWMQVLVLKKEHSEGYVTVSKAERCAKESVQTYKVGSIN